MFGNSNEYQLNKLQVGYSFKYNSKIWLINEVGEYHWKTGEISTEYIIENNNEKAFLEVEFYKGDYELYFSKKISIQDVFLKDAIKTETIMYNGKEFELDETYQGSYKSITGKSLREKLTSYVFYYDDEEMLTIEKWADETFEVFYGKELKKKKIKNIKSN